jgi:hypothetical protein
MMTAEQSPSIRLPSSPLKRKITARAAIFFKINRGVDRLSSLYQGADALGAQHFADFLAILKHAHGLEIGLERPRGSFIGPGAIATEGRFLSAMCTLSHNSTSLSDHSYRRDRRAPSRLTAAQCYHKSLSQASQESGNTTAFSKSRSVPLTSGYNRRSYSRSPKGAGNGNFGFARWI